MISQISENGAISEATRDEIEIFLTDICKNVSDFGQLEDYPQLAEFENVTECIETVNSTLDRITEITNDTDSSTSLRCHMFSNYIEVLLQVYMYTYFVVMIALSYLTGAG